MKPSDKFDKSWRQIRELILHQPLLDLVTNVLPNCRYTPRREEIFNVFSMPLQKIKVVILGQDPYPNIAHACGYAFANRSCSPVPKSLEVIHNEVLRSDPTNVNPSNEIDLHAWTDQGIFLLNTALTVESGKSGSHTKYWESFTIEVIKLISRQQPCIWLLWGNHAKAYVKYLPKDSILANRYSREEIVHIPGNSSINYILAGPHPMVEVYGNGNFIGIDHFYKVNKILAAKKESNITW